MRTPVGQCPPALLPPQFLRRMRRSYGIGPMAGKKCWRWLACAVSVCGLLAWCLLAHPYRLLTDESAAAANNGAQTANHGAHMADNGAKLANNGANMVKNGAKMVKNGAKMTKKGANMAKNGDQMANNGAKMANNAAQMAKQQKGNGKQPNAKELTPSLQDDSMIQALPQRNGKIKYKQVNKYGKKQKMSNRHESLQLNDRYHQIIIEQAEEKMKNVSIHEIKHNSGILKKKHHPKLTYNKNILDETEQKIVHRGKILANNVQELFHPKKVIDRKEEKITHNSTLDEIQMGSIEMEMQERLLKVRKTCSKYGLGVYRHPGITSSFPMRYPPTANYDVLYIDSKDALTWCPVYKAASTSWLHNFCLLAGVEESFLRETKEQISNIARRVWPSLEFEDAVQAVPPTTKFMIVRHPFERLVSAYRDKLENLNIGREHGVQHFYDSYGKRIVQKYRTKTSNDKRTRVRLRTDALRGVPEPQGVEPTFYEFVQYLLNTDLVHYADDHWMPYYLYCTTCYIDYNVILKFETLDRDQRYLIQKVQLDDRISPKWLHLTKNHQTSDIVKLYFDTISKSDIKKLYSKYKLDFEMYDYTINDYL